jgi:hypothetical protein
MFTPATAPFGSDPSYVSATYFLPPSPTSPAVLNIYLVFADGTTRPQLGVLPPGSSASADGSFCCTKELYARGVCSTKGALLLSPAPSGGRAPAWAEFKGVLAAAGGTGGGNFSVVEASPAYLAAVVCDAGGDALPASPPLALEMSAAFRNPYGWLPGMLAGLLPWYGMLLALYLALLLAYAGAFVVQRAFLLPLQWLVGGVILVGFLEMAASLGTFHSKNGTGVPTPCNICPVTSDYMAAVVLNVAKRAVSRVLLLAVAMGFGVVHPALPRRATALLAGLCGAYALSALLAAVERETTYEAGPNTWELPVVLLDLVFLVLINAYHTATTKGLTESGQAEKLRMYALLVKVVVANVVAHILLTLVVISVRNGTGAMDWRVLFLLNHFWDLLYFLVLAAGAWIWAPGPTAYRYAWYAQPVGGADAGDGAGGGGKDADAEAVALEMAAVGGAAGAAAATPSRAGAFAVGVEEEEEEGAGRAKAAGAAAATATAVAGGGAAAAEGGDGEAPSMLEESDRKRILAAQGATPKG